MKQVLVVRADLELSRGKAAAQAAHASQAASRKAPTGSLKKWHLSGEKKVVLAAKDENELAALEAKCRKLKLPCALIRDAGLTEVGPGTLTALGIGPADEATIDKVTGSLPLLK